MADDEIKKIKKQLEDLKKSLDAVGKANIDRIIDSFEKGGASLAEWKLQLKLFQTEADDVSNSLDYISKSLASSVSEMRQGNEQLRKQVAATRKLSSIADQLLSVRKGEIPYDKKKLANLREEAIQRKSILESRVNESGLSDAMRMSIQSDIDAAEELLKAFKSLEETNKNINKQLGAAPQLAAGIDKALSKLGLPDIGLSKAIDETRQMGQEAERTGEPFKAMPTFLGKVGDSFKSLFTKANLIQASIALLVDALKATDSGAGDLAKSMNMTYGEALDTRRELTKISALSLDAALNTKNLAETLMFVGKQLGSNAKLNEADLKTFTKLREQAGLANEEIMGMQNISLANGKSLDQNTKEFLAQAKITGLNKRVLLNEKDLYKEIGKISSATTLTLGKNPKELAKAAATAKALGIEMSKLEDIASGLLDFESSIENELSAELLTGKDLNLERARLLALNGDIAGMAEEINKQIGSSANFTNMNVIQQEALAKSVGMNREELAKTLLTQEQLQGLNGKQAEDAKRALDQRIEQVGVAQAQKELEEGSLETLMHQQSVQERFNQTVEKLKDIFMQLAIPILQIVSPIADLVGYMASIVSYVIDWGKYLLPIVAAYQTFKILTTAILALKQASNVADFISLGIGRSKIAQETILRALILKESIAKVIGNAWTSLGPIPFVGAALAAAAAAAGVAYLVSQANDMVSIGSNSPGYGKRTLMGPEGAIQLNDKDTVIAGTNLFGDDVTSSPGKPTETASKGTMKVAGGTPDMEQTNALLRQLISVVQSGGVVTLDGQKVGEALKLSSYKSQ